MTNNGTRENEEWKRYEVGARQHIELTFDQEHQNSQAIDDYFEALESWCDDEWDLRKNQMKMEDTNDPY